MGYTNRKKGFQPVSRPVEQILGFFQEFKKVTKKSLQMGPQCKPKSGRQFWPDSFGTAKPVTKALETELFGC